MGADLEPGTLLAGYRAGVFPMGLGRHGRGPLGWWSPDPRGVLPLGALRVPRSLRRSCRRFEIRVRLPW
jgi:leucyl/phenylalanyl-tRNA--protein transferase